MQGQAIGVDKPYMVVMACFCLFVCVLLMRTSMFVNDIELKEEDSKNEQKWVSTMLVLFSV